jgi:oligopeptide transport system substrate-binding protein
MGNEPPQLNSTKATDAESNIVLTHIMEGLTRRGKEDELIPGIAERWEITATGATFWLRDAFWTDGKPVRAQDFVFAWRTAVEPKNASEYAFLLYAIKNGQAVNEGKIPVTELAVQAIDDHTLQVTFEKPCPYFLGLTAFSTFLPLREDFYRERQERYAANAEDLMTNGPFRLTHWAHSASLTFEKDPRYWAADRIRLDRLEVVNITIDPSVPFNLFADGKIDYFNIVSDSLGRAQAERLHMKPFEEGSVWYIEFNHRPGRITRNVHLRRALSLAFDQKEYVSRVINVPGSRPGVSLVPYWMPGQEQRFRVEYPLPARVPDFEKARAELELAKQELGGSIPPLAFLVDDGPTSARQSEYIQNRFRRLLGLDLRIDKQTFKQRLSKMTLGEFDVVVAGWSADFADPMSYVELFSSWNGNNRGKYNNPEYDALVRRAQDSADPGTRFAAMAHAESTLLDDIGVLPLFERVRIYAHQPNVSGIVRHVVGADLDFNWATLAP